MKGRPRRRRVRLEASAYAELDLAGFRVEGFLDGSPVSASWDGHRLEVAEALAARLALARAIDAIFREAGLLSSGPDFSITQSASLALLSLIELCEVLTRVEYDTGAGSTRLA